MQPAGQVFHRTNLGKTISFKAGILAGKLEGRDNTSFDVFSANRGASFNIFIFEASGTFEFHFLEWRSEHSNLRWSPYFIAGAGILNISGHAEKTKEYSSVQPVLPLGFGFKYVINPKWYIGIEGGARVTFFDYLDNVSASPTTAKNYNNGNIYDNDLYYYLGVSVNYSFYEIPCPFTYK